VLEDEPTGWHGRMATVWLRRGRMTTVSGLTA